MGVICLFLLILLYTTTLFLNQLYILAPISKTIQKSNLMVFLLSIATLSLTMKRKGKLKLQSRHKSLQTTTDPYHYTTTLVSSHIKITKKIDLCQFSTPFTSKNLKDRGKHVNSNERFHEDKVNEKTTSKSNWNKTIPSTKTHLAPFIYSRTSLARTPRDC